MPPFSNFSCLKVILSNREATSYVCLFKFKLIKDKLLYSVPRLYYSCFKCSIATWLVPTLWDRAKNISIISESSVGQVYLKATSSDIKTTMQRFFWLVITWRIRQICNHRWRF